MDLSGVISKGGNHGEGNTSFKNHPLEGVRNQRDQGLYVCLLLGNFVPWPSQVEFSLVPAGVPLAQAL